MGDGEEKNAVYPIGVDMRGRRVVVVGGGPVAERRARGLLSSGAAVTLVAPGVTPELARMASEGQLRWVERLAIAEDMQGSAFVFLATDDEKANAELNAAARAAGALVSRADKGGEGDFVVPMLLRQESLTVAVFGGGTSPAFSRWLTRRIETAVGPEVLEFSRIVADARQRILAMSGLPQERRAELIRRVVEGDVFETLEQKGREAAERLIAEILDAA